MMMTNNNDDYIQLGHVYIPGHPTNPPTHLPLSLIVYNNNNNNSNKKRKLV